MTFNDFFTSVFRYPLDSNHDCQFDLPQAALHDQTRHANFNDSRLRDTYENCF